MREGSCPFSQAAFKKAHHAANLVYDMPPKTVLYPPSVGASKVVQFSLTDVNGIKIYRSEKGNEKMLECGTTCTAAIVQGRCVCLANVGDSLAVIGHEKQVRSLCPCMAEQQVAPADCMCTVIKLFSLRTCTPFHCVAFCVWQACGILCVAGLN